MENRVRPSASLFLQRDYGFCGYYAFRDGGEVVVNDHVYALGRCMRGLSVRFRQIDG